jgi:4-amino-4-deoxy-L-arabinose transferase-like glycosyltransferase
VPHIFYWLIGGFIIRMAIAFFLPPGFDEGYYYLYTQHLDWSYFDHPVMVALTTGVGPWLSRQVSPFTIRLGSLVLYTGSLGLMYLTSRRLFSAKAAELTVTIASLIPIFFVGFGVLTLPDSPLIFFWSATLYIAAIEFFPASPALDAINPVSTGISFAPLPPCPPALDAIDRVSTRNPSSPHTLIPSSLHPSIPYRPTPRLALIGLLIGLACLSKYHGAALGVGLVGFCVSQRRYWVVFRSVWMVGAIALFLLAVTPILIWNLQHDWISLKFQTGRAVPTQGYSILEMLGVFAVGLAYLFPTFGLPLWWVCGKAALEGRGQKAKGRGQRAEEAREAGEAREAREAGEARGISDSMFSLFPSSTSSVFPSPAAPAPLLSLGSPAAPLLLWLSLPLILGFTLMGGYRPILPTWAMPGFWGAMLLLGAFAERWQAKSPRGVRRWLWGSGWAIATILLIALSHVTLGTLQKPSQYGFLGGFLPISTDASVQLVDVEQLRQGFVANPVLRHALEGSDFVFVHEIFLAGQVGMAIAPFQRPLTCFSNDMRGFAFWSTPQDWLGKAGVYVTSTRQPNADQYQPYFQRIEKIGEIPIWRGGAIVETFQIYRCEKMLKPYEYQVGQSV